MARKIGRTKPDRRDRPAAPQAGTLPSRDDILAFLSTADGKAGKREIARAFGLKGGDKIGLKKLLKELAGEGAIAGRKSALRQTSTLSPVSVLDITGRTSDGDLIARPAEWNESEGPTPEILIVDADAGKRHSGDAAIGIGDRILARMLPLDTPDEAGRTLHARPLKRLAKGERRQLGILRASARGGGTIEPISRKELKSWTLDARDLGDAKDGDLVRFELTPTGRFSTPRARIVESLGNPSDQRKISLIAVHAYGLPDEFPERVIADAEALEAAPLGRRTDLRDVPLITIDPADARDHDDAVFAEPDSDPKNPGGHIVTVAIADVAHYVQSGSRLDREAELRGNSIYFPDRVVPMLPEKISNNLCSLREGEDRACLAVRMVYDRDGEKLRHTFVRGLMRSAAKLSYQEAQAAFDGAPSDKCKPLLETALKPLWNAYQAMKAARERRQPLNLDLPERKIKLDDQGRVAGVLIPDRLEAHRLIEEMMIAANVAAAETLEKAKTPLVYRVHDQPSREKLKALRDFLATLDLVVPPHGELKPAALNRVLARAKDLPVPELVNEVVLRSQAQAEYNPDNIGHFGLNLARYAHFTSPIRRYADLIVHRALIKALKFGDDGQTDEEAQRLTKTAQAISDAERRAMAAERETIDRLIAMHLAEKIGATFDGRISGVTRSGLFVRLKDTGADGFIPISTLGREFFNHAEDTHALIGSRSGEMYQLGDIVSVKLIEAIPAAGALRFEMVSDGKRRANSGVSKVPVRQLPRNKRGRR